MFLNAVVQPAAPFFNHLNGNNWVILLLNNLSNEVLALPPYAMHLQSLHDLLHSPLLVRVRCLPLPDLRVYWVCDFLHPMCKYFVPYSFPSIVQINIVQELFLLAFIIPLHPGSEERGHIPVPIHFHGDFLLLLFQLSTNIQFVPLIKDLGSQLIFPNCFQVVLDLFGVCAL